MTTTRRMPGCVNAFMISSWYGARLVFHRPGSAEVLDRIRYSSAHVLTVVFGSGVRPFRDTMRHSSSAVFIGHLRRLILHE